MGDGLAAAGESFSEVLCTFGPILDLISVPTSIATITRYLKGDQHPRDSNPHVTFKILNTRSKFMHSSSSLLLLSTCDDSRYPPLDALFTERALLEHLPEASRTA